MKLFVILLLFIASAASCQNTEEAQIITLQELETQFEVIQKLISEGTCSDSSQCNYIAYGTKACGGPQGYLVFSSEVDLEKLKNLVDKYTAAEDTYNKQNGIMSDCSIPSPPDNIECSDGKCVAVD